MTTAVLLHGAYGAPGDWTAPRGDVDLAAVEPAIDGLLSGNELDRLGVDDIAERLLGRLEEGLPSGQLILAGYSLGARLALGLAVRPGVAERTTGLLLVSGTAGLESTDERRRRAATDDGRANALVADPAAFLRSFWTLPMFAGLDGHPDRDALLARRIARASRDPDRLGRLMSGLSVGRTAPLWSRLGEVKAKSIVLCGARDRDYVGVGTRLAEGIPGAELRVIQGAGHALLLEAPTEVGRALRDLARSFQPFARPS
jgi:pimeloyl-ACP methyl ester carboxylesterase